MYNSVESALFGVLIEHLEAVLHTKSTAININKVLYTLFSLKEGYTLKLDRDLKKFHLKNEHSEATYALPAGHLILPKVNYILHVINNVLSH
jgi:hypothetical protein